MSATNTIDTIEDLIALLDRNPQWLDAVVSGLRRDDRISAGIDAEIMEVE